MKRGRRNLPPIGDYMSTVSRALHQCADPLNSIIGDEVCIDDFGDIIFRCHYRTGYTSARDAWLAGPIMPGVRRVKYICKNTAAAREAHRKSGIAFRDAEQNCNTCLFMNRIDQSRTGGFMVGYCTSFKGKPNLSPYGSSGNIVRFHPDDPMHMPCYISRWIQEE